jgi:hypothetical protein
MTNAATADQYIGRRAVDPQGNKIGSVGQVYLDDNTGQPEATPPPTVDRPSSWRPPTWGPSSGLLTDGEGRLGI